MSIQELKLEIISRILAIENARLLEDISEDITQLEIRSEESWEDLPEFQRQGILNAVDSLDRGEGIPGTVAWQMIRSNLNKGNVE